MGELFGSFEKLPMGDFDELVNSVCEWLEENFKNQYIKEIAQRSLKNLAATGGGGGGSSSGSSSGSGRSEPMQ